VHGDTVLRQNRAGSAALDTERQRTVELPLPGGVAQAAEQLIHGHDVRIRLERFDEPELLEARLVRSPLICIERVVRVERAPGRRTRRSLAHQHGLARALLDLDAVHLVLPEHRQQVLPAHLELRAARHPARPDH
jgi:hypothetical protein